MYLLFCVTHELASLFAALPEIRLVDAMNYLTSRLTSRQSIVRCFILFEAVIEIEITPTFCFWLLPHADTITQFFNERPHRFRPSWEGTQLKHDDHHRYHEMQLPEYYTSRFPNVFFACPFGIQFKKPHLISPLQFSTLECCPSVTIIVFLVDFVLISTLANYVP